MMEDQELIRLYFIEGRKNYAFNMMVRSYSERLYHSIRKILINHQDTDDALQNSFVKIWKALPSFKHDAQLYTWMYRIAVNEALALLRKQKKYRSTDYSDTLEKISNEPFFDGDKAYAAFLAAIAALPEKQQLVFKLKYFDELQYNEMAQMLGGSEGSLKASYHHAVKKIKEKLELD